MKTVTVTDIETNFSNIVCEVKKGEKFKILFGTSKEPVAMLFPVENKNNLRKIGVLDGKAKFQTIGNGKISEELFFGK